MGVNLFKQASREQGMSGSKGDERCRTANATIPTSAYDLREPEKDMEIYLERRRAYVRIVVL